MIGTSGWSYGHWRLRFYPAGLATRNWLRFYSRSFSTVEVNSTFYRTPRPDTVKSWLGSTPDDFVFAVKASRFLTHVKRLRPASDSMERFERLLKEFEDKLGPVLFQLPPTLEADSSMLDDFLEMLPAGVRAAFEFRHPRWRSDEILALLSDHGVAWVIADPEPGDGERVLTTDWTYLRFHGPPSGAAAYGKRRLRPWAEFIAGCGLEDVYVYFNNDAEGAAVRDAEVLRKLLEH